MDKYGKHNHPHTHEHMSLAAFTDHVRGHHHGIEDEFDLDGDHDHSTKRKVEWNHAAHIDVLPTAEKILRSVPLVFFGIEGCPKADSMWDAINREHLNASVVSVPGVGMWDCPELEDFVYKFLEGKTIIIVPDADWVGNPNVEHQARVFQGRLLSLDCKTVHIAAPPVELDKNGKPLQIKNANGKSKPIMRKAFNPRKGVEEPLKGVDDFLGLGSGKLTELLCIDREPPNRKMVDDWMDSQGVNPLTFSNTIVSLALMAAEDGRISVPFRTLGKIMGIDHSTIGRHIKHLERIGAVTVHGDLTTKWGDFGLDWSKPGKEDRPRIYIHPDLRAIQLPIRPLGEVLGANGNERKNLD